jgi:replicative DNA helicase
MEAERALLGGLLQEPRLLHAIGDIVTAADFYRPEHGALFALLVDMSRRGESIDLVTVTEQLARGGGADRYGGVAYVSELPEHVASTANLSHYADVVKEKSQLRDLIRTAQSLATAAATQSESAEQLLERAARDVASLGVGGRDRSWQPISLLVDHEVLRVQELEQRGGSTTGYSTGFVALDKILAGLQPTDLLILAARPGMGKTALALNIAQNVALLENVTVGLFSLEMSRGQLVTRMLCCHGLVDGNLVRTGKLDHEDWKRFLDASDYLRKASIHVDDTPGLSIGDVRARARRLATEHGNLGLVIIDYLQLMRGDDPRAPREQQISAISRGLKGLAKDLQCPVLALSQLNRGVESRADKRPLISDLRESGAIEQDADVIVFIYRDELYNQDTADRGLAEVIVAKQRNGPVGILKLSFQGQFTRFDNFLDDDRLL